MKELTILIPCLNEEKTLGICIEKAKKVIDEKNLDAEILVADNNSLDSSTKIAEEMGARVIEVEKKGYGNVLREGTKNAIGKFVIMADADDSYNFLEIMPILEELRNGYDLVIGNRYRGKMEKGAMPFSHKYIGTPILSFFVRRKFKSKIYDINCGMRGYLNDKILQCCCVTEGMEYATEMIIEAYKKNLKIKEIPINFYRDKRNKKSHLSTIKDGMRHLKLIMNS